MKKNAETTGSVGSVIYCVLLRLNPGTRGEHLTSQLSWAAARILVTCVHPVYLAVDELILVFYMAPCAGANGGSVEVLFTW